MSEIQEAGDIANVLDANTNYALLALLGNWVFADNPYVLEVIYSATAEEDPNTNLVELLGPNGTFCDTGKYSHIPFSSANLARNSKLLAFNSASDFFFNSSSKPPTASTIFWYFATAFLFGSENNFENIDIIF